MATLSKMCPVCGQQRMFRTGRPVNHWLHLAMTLLTGIWIIVWITLVVSRGSERLRCTFCGVES